MSQQNQEGNNQDQTGDEDVDSKWERENRQMIADKIKEKLEQLKMNSRN